MNSEQQELLIWGGGAFAGVVILAWLTATYSGQVQTFNKEIDSAYTRYQEHYSEGPQRQPLAQAQTLIRQAADEQAAVRQRIEQVVLAQLDANISNSVRHRESARPGYSYNQVVDEVDNRYRSLRGKGRRQNLADLPNLPFEGEETINAGDGLVAEQQRSLQFAQVLTSYHLLDYLLDIGVQNIASVEALPVISDDNTHPSYVGLGLRVAIRIEYLNLDRLLRDLREPSSQRSLQECTIVPDERVEGRFQVELAFNQLFAWPEQWDPEVILANTSNTTNRPTGGRSRGSRR